MIIGMFFLLLARAAAARTFGETASSAYDTFGISQRHCVQHHGGKALPIEMAANHHRIKINTHHNGSAAQFHRVGGVGGESFGLVVR